MFVRATRWFLIGAPAVAGILLLIFGTAGAISEAFGMTLIGIALLIWMSNWFIRMTFEDRGRDREASAREERARAQRTAIDRAQRPPGTPPHTVRRLTRRPRRPQ
jgi:hypothetical protein